LSCCWVVFHSVCGVVVVAHQLIKPFKPLFIFSLHKSYVIVMIQDC
jgi:hypothetical protein